MSYYNAYYCYGGAPVNNDELGGIFGSIGKAFKKVGKAALPLAGVAAGFIPGVGGLASRAIDLAAGVGGNLLANSGGSGGGGGGGVAKGLPAIQAFGQQVLSGLDQIEAAVAGGNLELVGKADELAATLSNPAMVFQPKKGKDADALNSAKQAAAQKVQSIKAKAAQVAQIRLTQTAPTATASGGGGLTAMLNGDGGGGDNTLLYLGIGGAALFAVFMLTKS